MSLENIQAISYALHALQLESSRVCHPHIYLRPRNMANTRSLIWDLSCGIDYRAKLGP